MRSRTSLGSLDISALPPALSAIGPKASIARVTPSVESIPTAPKPIPYSPISGILKPLLTAKAEIIAMAIMITGAPVDLIPTASPSMITVAGPYSACSAIPFVGLKLYEVERSVNTPIKIPASNPMIDAKKTPNEYSGGSIHFVTKNATIAISIELPYTPLFSANIRSFVVASSFVETK